MCIDGTEAAFSRDREIWGKVLGFVRSTFKIELLGSRVENIQTVHVTGEIRGEWT